MVLSYQRKLSFKHKVHNLLVQYELCVFSSEGGPFGHRYLYPDKEKRVMNIYGYGVLNHYIRPQTEENMASRPLNHN